MVRTQIVALSLGAGLAAVIGGVLAWQGLLDVTPEPVHRAAPLPQTATTPAVKTPAPAQTQAMDSVKTPLAPADKASPSAPSPTAAPKASQNLSPGQSPNSASAVTPTPSQGTASKSAAASRPKQATATAAAVPSAQADAPQFDTVRVEPSGESVVAGHGPANRKVALLAGDKVIGDAQTEDSGDFVIVPQPLAPGNYVLSLRSGTLRSRQSVTVSVPAKGKKGLVVALSEPGKPSVLLTDPTAPVETAQKPATSSEAAPQAAANVKPTVSFKTAEVDKGSFYASGFAPSGTHVRIYLNGSALADVIADSKGRWSLTIGKGMTGGHYVVRADAVDAKGKVMARAEVPFDMPQTVAEDDAGGTVAPKLNPAGAHPNAVASLPARPSAPNAEAVKPESAANNAARNGSREIAQGNPEKGGVAQDASGQNSSQPSSGESDSNSAAVTPKPGAGAAPEPSDASHAMVAEVNTAKVVRGDSLWRISRETLGHGVRYTLIYQANANQIRNPNLIYPGQVFVVPHVD